jgi:large subunit ribosomal protein L6
MSRVGRKAISIPSGVTVQVSAAGVGVEGPKGKLVVSIPPGIRVEVKDGQVVAQRSEDEQRALHGLARALVNNAILGVTKGFQKELDIVGVGYKAEVKGSAVIFSLGYSHAIDFPIPPGIKVNVEKQTHVVVSGCDRQLVGQVAANIRGLHPPDPYKHKGIHYTGETLKKKAGKAAATAKT